MLKTGALLEKEHFYIAENILRSFIEQKRVGKSDYLILNGLPRHVDQAKALEGLVRVEWIVHLDCPPDVVVRRIHANAGGDRCGRQDDDEELIARKLELFRRRTLPLLAYYRKRGAKIETFEVTERTTPEDIWRALGKRDGEKKDGRESSV